MLIIRSKILRYIRSRGYILPRLRNRAEIERKILNERFVRSGTVCTAEKARNGKHTDAEHRSELLLIGMLHRNPPFGRSHTQTVKNR